MNILLSCLFFQKFTGSEMYIFELAKQLKKLGNDVDVIATQTEGPLVKMANELGIKVFNTSKPPGFRLGDGIWKIEDNRTPSEPNKMYKIREPKYHIIHTQHTPVSEYICKLYPNIPKISTIHSEIISVEHPYKDPTIKRYIAIRPEIKEFICKNFNISEDLVSIIYNPVDNEKFKKDDSVDEVGYVLFVGTIDFLRERAIRDLIEYTRGLNKELWLVGENHSGYLNQILNNPHVKHFSPSSDVEQFIQKSSETAGILLGRTTIESWMCGKKSWIYNVNSSGSILDKKLYDVPKDIDKFYATTVASQIIKEYEKCLNNL